MSERPRRNHAAAFKAKVALEAVRGEWTIVEVVQKHDVHPNQVTDWRRQLLERGASVFDGAGRGLSRRFTSRRSTLRSAPSRWRMIL